MAIVESLTRMAGTLIAAIQTRLELVSVEVKEEALRYFTYLMMALAALFFAGIAILLVVFTVIALFWDDYRIEALVVLILLFGGGAAGIALWIRNSYRKQSRLFAHTLTELSKDIQTLKPSTMKH